MKKKQKETLGEDAAPVQTREDSGSDKGLVMEAVGSSWIPEIS